MSGVFSKFSKQPLRQEQPKTSRRSRVAPSRRNLGQWARSAHLELLSTPLAREIRSISIPIVSLHTYARVHARVAARLQFAAAFLIDISI